MFSKIIKQLRIEKGYTQQYLADYLSVKRPTYTRYETGTNEPDYETIQKIASLYGVTVDFLLNGETGTKKISPSDDELILEALKDPELRKINENLIKLNPDQLQKADEYLDFLLAQQKKRNEEK